MSGDGLAPAWEWELVPSEAQNAMAFRLGSLAGEAWKGAVV